MLNKPLADPPDTHRHIVRAVAKLTARKGILRSLFSHYSNARRVQFDLRAGTPPSEGRILEHVAEDTSGQSQPDCMFSTFQLIVDFCAADIADLSSLEASPGSEEALEWVSKLEELKHNFEASRHNGKSSEPVTIENLGLLPVASEDGAVVESKDGTTSDHTGKEHEGHMAPYTDPYEERYKDSHSTVAYRFRGQFRRRKPFPR
ncbi:hypothetical protein RhiJN_25756 [Ceratobasidium sp. AG-Ba]|nr:hypothetical protein RhiJN_25756 [Ceratobasidium sp. AG-Ba]